MDVGRNVDSESTALASSAPENKSVTCVRAALVNAKSAARLGNRNGAELFGGVAPWFVAEVEMVDPSIPRTVRESA